MTDRPELAFVAAVAEACGIQFGQIQSLTIHFDAPQAYAEVTASLIVGPGFRAVVKRFVLNASELPP